MASGFFHVLARLYPDLKDKLKKSHLNYRPEEFIRRTFIGSFYMAFGLFVGVTLFLLSLDLGSWLLLIIFPFVFGILFVYLMNLPDVKINKQAKMISKEIVFGGRYLIIELQSGVPLYDALKNVTKNYEAMGIYLKEVTDKIDFGTSLEDALADAIEGVPSDDMRRVLWQILNSLRTGANVGDSLSTIVEQISREQLILVSEYGKKLNPLAMFYMIIAVILPTLGITMLIVLSSFVEFEMNMTILIFIAFMLGFMQFMFLSIINFSRPPIEF